MKRILTIFSILVFSGCVHESAVPLGNDLAEIDVSAASVYGRAGAQRIAFENVAKTTLKLGYDKFIVLNNNDWNESTFNAGSYGQATVNGSGGQATGGSYATTIRHPESKLIIHMYHEGDKNSSKGVDARSVLKLNSE